MWIQSLTVDLMLFLLPFRADFVHSEKFLPSSLEKGSQEMMEG